MVTRIIVRDEVLAGPETISMTCKCGSTFNQRLNYFINGGGTRDDRGRQFIAEVQADAWREMHSACLQKR